MIPSSFVEIFTFYRYIVGYTTLLRNIPPSYFRKPDPVSTRQFPFFARFRAKIRGALLFGDPGGPGTRGTVLSFRRRANPK